MAPAEPHGAMAPCYNFAQTHVLLPGTGIVRYNGHMNKTVTTEESDGWIETMDIMSNPEEVAAIAKGMKEKERGEVVTLEEFKNSLGA
ncbi:MAG: Antitoxin [Candidatus Peribacteria bacterium]|nr:Antitoxin [Candidatus Peribacteria bacterium]